MLSFVKQESDPKCADDRQLLRLYAETGSEKAFAVLVERYIALVHSAALRQCGNDPHKAQDVTQIVFMALAQKAGQIGRDVLLAGWLTQATHFASRSLLRAESRRQRHERRAAMLQERKEMMNSGEHGTAPTSNSDLWKRISPYLDEALARIPSGLRDVLVLRFLEGCAFAVIGERLGLTEEAARKRAQRGLHSLREALARRGVVTYDDALEAALAGALAAPAPAHLAQAVAAGAGTTHHHSVVLKGALKLMAWSKAKIVASSVAAALLLGGGGAVVHRLINPPSNTLVIPISNNGGPAVVTVRQAPSSSPLVLRGTVRDAGGQPVAGAKVMAPLDRNTYLELTADPQMGPPTAAQAVTESRGSFEVPVQKTPVGVLILAQEGAAESSAPAGDATLTIQPYGRIEGTLRFDHKPVQAGTEIMVSTAWLPGHGAQFQMRARTDQAGHFAIENVPPGQYAMFFGSANGEVHVEPRTSARVDVDRPSGRSVVGKLEGMKERGSATFLFFTRGSKSSSQPASVFVLTAWQLNAEVELDGAFRIDHVPPGAYRLSVANVPGFLGGAQANVQISPSGDSEAPINIGTLKLKPFGQ